jgi:uncharacterized protein YneF (UPF0154 family)
MADSPPTSQLLLDDASRHAIKQARNRRKRIDRVLGVASFNGWSAAVLATLSVLIGVFVPTLITVLAAGVLIAVAYTEFHGRTLVKQLNTRGLVVLTWNQLAFGVMIILYAAWQLYVTSQGQDSQLQELASVGEMGQQLADMEQQLLLLVYWMLILGTVAFQGGMAWFYFASRKPMQAFIDQTPPWVIDVLEAVI